MSPTHTNRLAKETSPYLLQHAHNPVDWFPWGPEAFERAVREGAPIFLSIGYAACHWCHVMERESFEDEETARLMNENFVCIKVDGRPAATVCRASACSAPIHDPEALLLRLADGVLEVPENAGERTGSGGRGAK